MVTLKTSGATDLPTPGMELDPKTTAIVMTDPQNDFLSPGGVAYGVVGKNVEENGTVGNLLKLFKVAKKHKIPLFISPHYYYPHDHKWKFEGSLETVMHSIHMFDRKGPTNMDGFDESGADWVDMYKPYIKEGNVVVTHAHKMYGPETNDLVLQLRKRGIAKVILCGMSANLCTESHLRELTEQGFNCTVVKDATAAAKTEVFDGYQAAVTNFYMIAAAVVTTDEAVSALDEAFANAEWDS